MLMTNTDTFDVPAALATILDIRETSTYQRTLYFKNLTGSALAAQIEYSADGGSTWVVVGTSFTVGAVGSGSDVIVKTVDNTNILRVRASGGSDDRDLYIGYARIYKDALRVWTSPLV